MNYTLTQTIQRNILGIFLENVAKIKKYATHHQTIFFFRVWAIWEERKFVKLYPSIQMWELHSYNPLPVHGFGRPEKEKIDFPEEAKLAAYELFKVVYETTIIGAHSIEEGQMVLLFEYLSDFENSEIKIQKVMSFIESLSLERIGSKATEGFLLNLQEAEMESEASEPDNRNLELDDEQIANLEIGE